MQIFDSSYEVLSKPLILLGKIFYQNDWQTLKQLLSDKRAHNPQDIEWLKVALVLSEDHRFYKHRGVDIYAMGRATFRYLFFRRIEGASTITQQLVRVISGRYERTFKRKFREILLSCMLEKSFNKEQIISLYLDCAYFGWRMNGFEQAMKRLNISYPINLASASKIIARLKYPEPQFSDPKRAMQIMNRELHIQQLFEILNKNGTA